MSLNKYYHNMGMAKGLLVMALILIIMGWAVCGYCHTFEMDYSGPGSEIERFNEQCRDERNRDSWEREQRGEANERDHEMANEYENDHGV